jgi:hypothetical protein
MRGNALLLGGTGFVGTHIRTPLPAAACPRQSPEARQRDWRVSGHTDLTQPIRYSGILLGET